MGLLKFVPGPILGLLEKFSKSKTFRDSFEKYTKGVSFDAGIEVVKSWIKANPATATMAVAYSLLEAKDEVMILLEPEEVLATTKFTQSAYDPNEIKMANSKMGDMVPGMAGMSSNEVITSADAVAKSLARTERLMRALSLTAEELFAVRIDFMLMEPEDQIIWSKIRGS